ncbi:DUF2214 family protein [Longitalea luteola]|uniref:DUF2214 family protein n=1 Tax=Longitalea luteola TaxID=2812563 RepID=UPI001A964547|nr:DUF2214 family protein [Longitalea luteola]
MYLQTIRQLLLIIHLSGLTLMAGTTVAAFVTFRAFINRFNIKSEGTSALLKLLSNLGAIKGIGGILLILSGIGLTIVTGSVFLHMLWLQLKLSIILLMVLNEMLIGNRQLKKLTTAFSENNSDGATVIKMTVPKIVVFYTIQLLLFLGIIVLAVFKFN